MKHISNVRKSIINIWGCISLLNGYELRLEWNIYMLMRKDERGYIDVDASTL